MADSFSRYVTHMTEIKYPSKVDKHRITAKYPEEVDAVLIMLPFT